MRQAELMYYCSQLLIVCDAITRMDLCIQSVNQTSGTLAQVHLLLVRPICYLLMSV